jgi:hypothetical protein
MKFSKTIIHFHAEPQKRKNSKKGTFRHQKINTKMSIFASKVAGGHKYCKNERVCNSLIINNKTFKGQKRVCNLCLIGVPLRLNQVAIVIQMQRN